MGYGFDGRLTSSPGLIGYQLPLTQTYETHSDSSSTSSYDAGQLVTETISANYSNTMPFNNQQTTYLGPAEKIPIQFIDTTSLDGGSRRSRPSNNTGEEPTTMHLRRRAQNRASQRAFRERKERHVKSLENQLHDLHGQHRLLLDSYNRQSEDIQNLHGRIQTLLTELATYRRATGRPFDNNGQDSHRFQPVDKLNVTPFSNMPYHTPEPYFETNTGTTQLLQQAFGKD